MSSPARSMIDHPGGQLSAAKSACRPARARRRDDAARQLTTPACSSSVASHSVNRCTCGGTSSAAPVTRSPGVTGLGGVRRDRCAIRREHCALRSRAFPACAHPGTRPDLGLTFDRAHTRLAGCELSGGKRPSRRNPPHVRAPNFRLPHEHRVTGQPGCYLSAVVMATCAPAPSTAIDMMPTP